MELTLNVNAPKDDMEYFENCDLFLLKNVFKCDESVKTLLKEVDSLCYDYSVNDLHSLAQTSDLVLQADNLTPFISKFVGLMQTQVRNVIEDLFHVKTKENITMTASKYNTGDYLLCHDDLCNDRHIAFVYYLSDDWKEADGGALRFFKLQEYSNVPVNDDEYRQVFVPIFNSLVAFRVSGTSYHEVQQVYSDKTRISINGWFHCDTIDCFSKNKEQLSIFIKSPLLQFDKYNPEINYVELVHSVFKYKDTLQGMSKTLKSKTALMAEDFLAKSLYDSCLSELQGDVPWTMKGPANHRKYEVLEVDVKNNRIKIPHNPPYLTRFLETLVSQHWLHYLNELTNLEFAVFSEKNVPPVCIIEIQRWKEGYYSLLADDDFQKKFPTLDVTFFFGVDNIIIGGEKSPPKDISGHIIQSVIKNNSSYFRALAKIKTQKLLSDRLKLGSWSSKSKVVKVSQSGSFLNKNLISRLSHPGIKSLVENKIAKLKQYRQRGVDLEENNIFVPKSNVMLLTMNCDSAVKFTSFIRHSKTRSESKTCYYGITISYLTTCAYNERL